MVDVGHIDVTNAYTPIYKLKKIMEVAQGRAGISWYSYTIPIPTQAMVI